MPTNSKVFVVAHSHGGNVALRALTLSSRDAETIVLLGTPFLGVALEVEQTGLRYQLPLYLPLPREASKTHIVNVYSPQDGVATDWADLIPGATFADLQHTNEDSWWRHFRLDRAKVRVPRRQRAGYRTKKIDTRGFYQGTGVVGQEIDENLGVNITNISVSAQTSLGAPAIGVHEQLHSAQVARALAHALATDSFNGLADSVGVLHR